MALCNSTTTVLSTLFSFLLLMTGVHWPWFHSKCAWGVYKCVIWVTGQLLVHVLYKIALPDFSMLDTSKKKNHINTHISIKTKSYLFTVKVEHEKMDLLRRKLNYQWAYSW